MKLELIHRNDWSPAGKTSAVVILTSTDENEFERIVDLMHRGGIGIIVKKDVPFSQQELVSFDIATPATEKPR